MTIPSIDEIKDAVRASRKTSPRPTRAFWAELFRSFAHPADPVHIDDMSEADMCAAIVVQAIWSQSTADAQDAARERWARVLGLVES